MTCYNTHVLLTKHEFKTAGYQSSFFLAFLWPKTKSRSVKMQKRARPIFSHLDQTSVVHKEFIYLCGKSQADKMDPSSPLR